jgi:hypothetical protein
MRWTGLLASAAAAERRFIVNSRPPDARVCLSATEFWWAILSTLPATGDYRAREFMGMDKLLRGGRYEVTGIAIKKTKQKIRFLFAVTPGFVLPV